MISAPLFQTVEHPETSNQPLTTCKVASFHRLDATTTDQQSTHSAGHSQTSSPNPPVKVCNGPVAESRDGRQDDRTHGVAEHVGVKAPTGET